MRPFPRRALSLALLLGACVRGGPPPGPAAPMAVCWSPVIDRALPSVVLLVNHRKGEPDGFGAGVLVDPDGLVLTSLHVVDRAEYVGAFLYDPTLPTWSPLDGGLSRFAFEHQAREIPVTRLRDDPVLDLALVRVEADTRAWPLLPVRKDPVQPGEPVLALGHPAESLWSFTAGVVSAIHQGVIQHDAALNRGNSGGPLVDASGRLVGINTMKLIGTAEGMAYARPADMAMALLDQEEPRVVLDLSEPGLATTSCERAIEFVPDAGQGCVDWQAMADLLPPMLEQARQLVMAPDPVWREVEKVVERDGWRVWVGHWQAEAARHAGARPEDEPEEVFNFSAVWPSDAARVRHLAEHDVARRIRATLDAHDARVQEEKERTRARNRYQEDFWEDPSAYRNARKRGLRVEETRYPTPDRALVRIVGRNPDGSLFGYTECWARKPEGWKQYLFCTESDLLSLPGDWPLPMGSALVFLPGFSAALAARVAGLTPEDLGRGPNARTCDMGPDPVVPPGAPAPKGPPY